MKKNIFLRKKILTGAALAAVCSLALPVLASTGSRTAKLEYDDIKLVVNGQNAAKDSSGNTAEPFRLNGVTYVPIQAVGDALGMEVRWDAATKTISLTGAATQPTLESNGWIGIEKAKSIALQHADVKAADATFFQASQDWDDGRATYDIEFYSGNTEYDYEIDAVTGAVLSWDHEAENYRIPSQDETAPAISLERAKALAQAKAPGATLVSCKLDNDDGRLVYEGELRNGKMEYEFEIDAATGNFLKWSVDQDD